MLHLAILDINPNDNIRMAVANGEMLVYDADEIVAGVMLRLHDSLPDGRYFKRHSWSKLEITNAVRRALGDVVKELKMKTVKI